MWVARPLLSGSIDRFSGSNLHSQRGSEQPAIVLTENQYQESTPTSGSGDPLPGLAMAAANGDRDAMRSLLRSLAPSVMRIAKAVLGPAHPDVEDATQDSLLAFARALPNFRHECHPVGYASRITVRTTVALRRRHQEDHQYVSQQAVQDLDSGDTTRGPHEELSSQRRMQLVRELLQELPFTQAEALALRIVLGCSLQEVSEVTGVPLNTVRSRVRLAKQALQRRIGSDPRLRERLEVQK